MNHSDTIDYQQVEYAYRHSADQDAAAPVRHPVVVVGAGPIGLALAIDLALQQVPVVLLDNDHRLSVGSRAICFSKRTLEIFDRLGCGQRLVDKGVSWSLGKVFLKDQPVYAFNLLPESGHERPAFINLQQYYLEGYLVERAAELPLIDLRWQSKVVGLVQQADQALLEIETPEGRYQLAAAHVVACDGARSTLRGLCGETAHGRIFRDRFLIADVRMKADFPAERWFWFDPPFHPGQSVLLHKQPDNVWRIDFQLGWDADPEHEKRPEVVLPRVRAMLAHTAMKDAEYELEWASVYTFACERMDSFRQGRVLFAGDAAHRVSPFGARGANSGVQDTENLAWKLAYVLHGRAPEALLDSYDQERVVAADENLLNSSRATDFITPKSEISRLFRDATLQLAARYPFARTLVNSGRLSEPCTLRDSPLNSADDGPFSGGLVPGAPALDAPVTQQGRPSWLLRQLDSGMFTALVFEDTDPAGQVEAFRQASAGLAPLQILLVGQTELPGVRTLQDSEHYLAQRYAGHPGTAYLLRPDQHVCARWHRVDASAVCSALRRALAQH